jgi:hypothetical protein
MKDIKISEKSVETALNRLSPSKATGPEKVPVRILKETANILELCWHFSNPLVFGLCRSTVDNFL